jgi:MscS family membrane protein
MSRHRFSVTPRGAARIALATALMLPVTSRATPPSPPSLKELLKQSENLEGKPADHEESKAQEVPQDELGRGTPRRAVAGFLRAARERDYERAAEYLDRAGLPPAEQERGALYARALKIVLDQTLWVDLDSLSDAPEGQLKDGLPPSRDRVGQIKLPDGRTVDVLVQRVRRKDGVEIWKFAGATVARLGDLWKAFGYGPLTDVLPLVFFDIEIAGIRLWQWLALVALLPVAWVVAWLVTAPFLYLLRRRDTRLAGVLRPLLGGPIRLILMIGLVRATQEPLRLSIVADALLAAVERTAFVAALAWFGMRLVDIYGQRLITRLVATGRPGLVASVPTLGRLVKGLVVLLALVNLLAAWGIDVTALVAGLGVGGIAVALAAQKTMENFVGGFALLGNQPVRAGDFCRFGDQVGTVEEIGLYATRVRTLERSVVTIPNAQFSNLQLDNLSRREKFWYHPRISLRYETTPDQLRYVLVEVGKLLHAHARVDPDPARVRFEAFGAYSLDLGVFAYVHAADYSEFLEVAEDLNLRIIDIVAAAGTSMAFPSQTTYLESGTGVNDEQTHTVEERVARWREQGELCVPRFPQSVIDRIEGTIAYPPPGSAISGVDGRGAGEPCQSAT